MLRRTFNKILGGLVSLPLFSNIGLSQESKNKISSLTHYIDVQLNCRGTYDLDIIYEPKIKELVIFTTAGNPTNIGKYEEFRVPDFNLREYNSFIKQVNKLYGHTKKIHIHPLNIPKKPKSNFKTLA